MLINGVKRCISCMSPLDSQGKCGHCHYKQIEYIPTPRCLQAGTILEKRYCLGKVLGEGTFGITYIGWDMLLDSKVAIKEYYPVDLVSRDALRGANQDVAIYCPEDQIGYEDNLEKFLKEARCLSRFYDMPGVVSVHNFFYANKTAYIVMEYVDGISLRSYIEKNGAIKGDKMMAMMKPVLQAMAEIHESGLVHRDISPDNLLVTPKGQLVLIDFGSARVGNSDFTRKVTIMFKRGFSPAEQYREEGKQGAWSDVYSLCATMYYMICAKIPEEAVERLIDDDIESLADVLHTGLSMHQRLVIMKGMSLHPEERYQKIGDLLIELEQEMPDMRIKENNYNHKKLILISMMAAVFFLVIGILCWPKNDVYYVTRTNIELPVLQQPFVEMINVTMLTANEAEKQLKQRIPNLEISYQYQFHLTIKKDLVIEQSFAKGEKISSINPGKLVLKVSKGMKQTVMPKVIGMTIANAKTLLDKKNIVYQVNYIYHNQMQNTVLTQDISKGSKVAKGAVLTLEVSLGPKSTKKKSAKDYAGVIE